MPLLHQFERIPREGGRSINGRVRDSSARSIHPYRIHRCFTASYLVSVCISQHRLPNNMNNNSKEGHFRCAADMWNNGAVLRRTHYVKKHEREKDRRVDGSDRIGSDRIGSDPAREDSRYNGYHHHHHHRSLRVSLWRTLRRQHESKHTHTHRERERERENGALLCINHTDSFIHSSVLTTRRQPSMMQECCSWVAKAAIYYCSMLLYKNTSTCAPYYVCMYVCTPRKRHHHRPFRGRRNECCRRARTNILLADQQQGVVVVVVEVTTSCANKLAVCEQHIWLAGWPNDHD